MGRYSIRIGRLSNFWWRMLVLGIVECGVS